MSEEFKPIWARALIIIKSYVEAIYDRPLSQHYYLARIMRLWYAEYLDDIDMDMA